MARSVAAVLWDKDVQKLRVDPEGAHESLAFGEGKCAYCGEEVDPPPRLGPVLYFVVIEYGELWHWDHEQEFIEREKAKP
jgi:hypothetical protein